jgi:competence protein ComEC
MFYAAACLAAGIALGTPAWRPPAWWVAAALVLLLAAVYWMGPRPEWAALAAMGAFLPLGALLAQGRAADATPLPDLSAYTKAPVTVTAHVVREGLIRDRGSDQALTVDVETESIATGDGPEPAVLGARLTIFARETEEEAAGAPIPRLRYGERVRFEARLREPRNYGQPGAMDYRGYLRERGIVLLASVRADRLTQLPGDSGSTFEKWRSRMRASLVDHMLRLAAPRGQPATWTRMSQDDAGLLAAMIIGEQSLIRRDTRAEFQRTGVFHILVVSGANVGILAFVVFLAAKWLRASEAWATILTLALTLLYALVTDLGPPILRAAIMLALYLIARWLYREKYSLNSVGTAGLLVLAADPGAVYDASFQLTFLCVVALSGMAQPILERSSQPYRRALHALGVTGFDVNLEPRLAQLRLDLRMIAGRVARILPARGTEAASLWLLGTGLRGALSLYDLIVVTGLMQVALALPMVLYFHRVAVVGLPANMVVAPLTGVLMPMGIAATLLDYVSGALAALPAMVTSLALHGITAAVRSLGGARFAELRMALPETATAWLAALAFALATFSMRRSRLRMGLALALLAGSALLLLRPPKPRLEPGVTEVTVLDVGQGDSILVVSPEGRTLLVDGGGPMGFVRTESFDVGEDVVSPYLWSRRLTRLDAVALSHAHSDHLGGLHSLLANFRPRELWIGLEGEGAGYRRLMQEADRAGITIRRLRRGDAMGFGGAQIHVLGPGEEVPDPRKRNNESLVLKVTQGRTSMLLTGDAEREAELRVAGAAGRVDVLKVAHHGSATSTTPELLQAVRPRYAAISAGYRNVYGHPKPVVVQRLTAAGVRTFRTDRDGAITFRLDGATVTARVDVASR